MQTALSKFQSLLLENNLDGFIVTNPYNILYLSGFKGISPSEREAILTVTQNHATLITARLYQSEAKKAESKKLKVQIAAERNEIDNFLKNSLKKTGTIGFEEADLKYSEYLKYKKLLTSRKHIPPSKYSPNALEVNTAKKSNIRMSSSRMRGSGFSIESRMTPNSSRPASSNNIKFIPTKKLIENLRIIKTPDELGKIEKAQLITQKAFDKILPTIKAGQTELEIDHTLKSILHSLGAEGLAFEPIIASGPNSGIPHHVTGKRKIKMGDALLFDFGAKFQNYCSDFSRTVFIGKATDTQRSIYNHVLTAQKNAFTIIKHGIYHHEPFDMVNNHFRQNKLEKYFTHGLGHGIGLEVHEAPYLRSKIASKQSTINPSTALRASNQQLTNGMVFSVEPGLYFNWGGVRIEDLVTIQNDKIKVFDNLTGDLIEINP